MTTNKKLVILIGIMSFAIASILLSVVIVLVSNNQNAKSVVNVKYEADEVYVELSATAYLGVNIYEFTEDSVVDGNKSIELSPDKPKGTLSQQNNIASLELSKEDKYIIFEYVFINKVSDIDVNINLERIPGDKLGERRENLIISYGYSDTKVDRENFDTIEFNSDYVDQKLSTAEGESNEKYIYIKAEIDQLLLDAELYGSFGWALSKIK